MESLKRQLDAMEGPRPVARPRRGPSGGQVRVDSHASSQDGKQLLGFGKHMWLTFRELAEQQRDYCYWVLEFSKPSDQMKKLQAYLRIHPDFSPEAIATSAGLAAGLDPSLPVWVQRVLQIGTQAPVPAQERPSIVDGLRRDMAGLLHNYQLEGIAFGVGHRGRVLLGDEMGLGKTVQALAIAVHYREDWPVLIVVPAPLRTVWRLEIQKWLPDARVQVVTSGCDALKPAFNIYVISYDLAGQQEHFLRPPRGGDFQVVICDESHYLRHDTSRRTQVLVPVLKQARRAILLSGTPLLNRAFDVYPQLDALAPGVIPTPGAFGERYGTVTDSPWHLGKAYQGVQRSQELSQVLGAVMIQRRKADVAAQLPPKRWRLVPVTVPKASLQDEALAQGGEPEDAQKRGYQWWMHAWIEVGKAKIQSALDYVSVMLEGLVDGEKVLVFAHHREVIEGLSTGLRALRGGDGFLVRIDGSTSQAQRESNVRRFQDDAAVRVAVLSITSCCLGITLTAASHVVFAELFAVPGVMRQAEDRAHRVGQRRCVDIHYLVAHGTIDDRVMESFARKRDELAGVIIPGRDHQRALPAMPEVGSQGAQHAQGAQVMHSRERSECYGPGCSGCPRCAAVLRALGARSSPVQKDTSASDLTGQAVQPLERKVSVSKEALAQLVGMGFEADAAHAALVSSCGKLEGAVEALTAATDNSDHESSSAAGTKLEGSVHVEASSVVTESRSHHASNTDRLFQSSTCSKLEDAGESSTATTENSMQQPSSSDGLFQCHALKATGGTIDLSESEEVDDVEAMPPLASRIDNAASRSCTDSSDDAIAHLMSMGFNSSTANDALRRAGGRLEGALEALLSC